MTFCGGGTYHNTQEHKSTPKNQKPARAGLADGVNGALLDKFVFCQILPRGNAGVSSQCLVLQGSARSGASAKDFALHQYNSGCTNGSLHLTLWDCPTAPE